MPNIAAILWRSMRWSDDDEEEATKTLRKTLTGATVSSHDLRSALDRMEIHTLWGVDQAGEIWKWTPSGQLVITGPSRGELVSTGTCSCVHGPIHAHGVPSRDQ